MIKDESVRLAVVEIASALDVLRQGGTLDAKRINAILALANEDDISPYGFCPICGEPGTTRERRPNGDDACANGHRYFSRMALDAEQAAERRKRNKQPL